MYKPRLKTGLLPLLAAAMLAAGCTKEASVPGLRIFEESMNDGGSKVLVDPSNPTSNRWLAGGFFDDIGIYDGSTAAEYEIQQTESGDFYVDYTSRGSNMVAWYPYYLTGDHSNLSTIRQTSTESVTVGWWDFYMQRADGIELQFPMVAFADAGSTSLMFRHVTGAVAFTVKNNTGKYIDNISHIIVEAKRGGEPVYLWPNIKVNNDDGVNDGNGFVCSMSNTGMNISYLKTPSAENSCDDLCDYHLQKEGVVGFSLAPGDSFLCILPIPVTGEATDFTLTAENQGIDPNHYQEGTICQRTISGLTIERNHMYKLPTFYLAD